MSRQASSPKHGASRTTCVDSWDVDIFIAGGFFFVPQNISTVASAAYSNTIPHSSHIYFFWIFFSSVPFFLIFLFGGDEKEKK